VISADFRLSRLFRSQPFIILIVIVTLAIAISIFSPVFLSLANLSIVLQQSSVTGIATMCMVLLMISGGLDFSIGSIISLSCVVMAKLIELKYGVGLTIVAGIGVATVCGLLNGFIVAKSRCPPIIITLGMLYIYYGIALNIAQGRFLNLMGKFEALGDARILFIPYPVLQWLAVAICVFVLLKFTVFGRRLFSLGGNEEAAFLSGIETGRHKIIAYTINGFISGIAALVLV
jgi:ribose transport system permease protein